MTPERPEAAEVVSQLAEVAIEAAPEQPPPKRRGRPPGSTNKKAPKHKKQPIAEARRVPKPPKILANIDYAVVSKIPSNVVFIPLDGKWISTSRGRCHDPKEGYPETRWSFRRKVEDDGTLSDSWCEVVVVHCDIPSSKWPYFKVGATLSSQDAMTGAAAGFKVIEVTPLSQTRINQIAFLFVKVLLEKYGITLSRSTRRQIGQWATAINVQFDELMQALRPFVRKTCIKLLRTAFDQEAPMQEVESSPPEVRLHEIAYLFAKWIIQTYGISLLKRNIEGELTQWASEIEVPLDEIKMAIRPIIEEVEAEALASKNK